MAYLCATHGLLEKPDWNWDASIQTCVYRTLKIMFFLVNPVASKMRSFWLLMSLMLLGFRFRCFHEETQRYTLQFYNYFYIIFLEIILMMYLFDIIKCSVYNECLCYTFEIISRTNMLYICD